MSFGGRSTRSEFDTETVRNVYVLLWVQSTASSEGLPLIVNLMLVPTKSASSPDRLAALDSL